MTRSKPSIHLRILTELRNFPDGLALDQLAPRVCPDLPNRYRQGIVACHLGQLAKAGFIQWDRGFYLAKPDQAA
jgi:hypothetical protein